MGSPLDVGKALVALLPLLVGLAFGRAGLIAASYGSYRQSDDGIFTDGAMIVALLIFLIPFAIITSKKKTIPDSWVDRIALACIAVEVLAMLGMGVLNAMGATSFPLRFGLSVVCTITASGAMFYWLRCMKGTGTVVSVLFVFSALVLSEIELLISAALPSVVGIFFAGILAAVQFPCMRWAKGRTIAYSREKLAAENAFPGFDDHTLKSRQLLIVMAVSIGLLGIVAGFLRGYPNGEAIPFHAGTRFAYFALTVALAILAIALTVGKRKHLMPVGLFLILELLSCAALVCYAALPGMLDVGAVFTTTLNALMVGLAWYIIIAFMSFGWREPYYYALAGWFVWLGARSVVRTAFVLTPGIIDNSTLAIALTATLVVMSAQATLSMFLSIERQHADEAEEAAKAAESPSKLVRIMGLDKGQTLTDLRQESMRHSAEIMGKQFLLSDREVDVLALYALGYTQKKVAEKLIISQSTAHEHVKRIYTKTGLHSRQEILDYIAQYAS